MHRPHNNTTASSFARSARARTLRDLAIAALIVLPCLAAQAAGSADGGLGETACGFVKTIVGVLNAVSIVVVTVAIIFSGYQIAFAHKRISDVAPVFIGVVYATNTSGKRLLWIARPELPADVYQGRATHCMGHGDALYVLLQSDTQASQSISQTLLRVVKLDASLGTVQLQKDVEVPGSYSAWVDKGATRFVWKRNRLVINGNSRLGSDHERVQNFTVRLNSDLEPKGSKP